MQVVFACVYGEGTTLRLKQYGMEFAVWVFKHAADDQLLPSAPTILKGLTNLLFEDETASSFDQPTLTLRGFTYQVPTS